VRGFGLVKQATSIKYVVPDLRLFANASIPVGALEEVVQDRDAAQSRVQAQADEEADHDVAPIDTI
jgi:hypothetical protein